MAACDGKDLLTVAVAPHQVYGPRDYLFLHNFLLNAKRLRVFGPGDNLVACATSTITATVRIVARGRPLAVVLSFYQYLPSKIYHTYL